MYEVIFEVLVDGVWQHIETARVRGRGRAHDVEARFSAIARNSDSDLFRITVDRAGARGYTVQQYTV